MNLSEIVTIKVITLLKVIEIKPFILFLMGLGAQ